jgi:hypothetical protein
MAGHARSPLCVFVISVQQLVRHTTCAAHESEFHSFRSKPLQIDHHEEFVGQYAEASIGLPFVNAVRDGNS